MTSHFDVCFHTHVCFEKETFCDKETKRREFFFSTRLLGTNALDTIVYFVVECTL